MARTALVTGGAKRLGAATVRALHAAGFDVIVHYGQSRKDAEKLVNDLNKRRPDSAVSLAADLTQPAALRLFAREALGWRGGVDVLVNNAARFRATPLADATDRDWDELIGANLRAPFLLAQLFAASLKERHGCILNMVDIYAEKPLLGHPLYSMTKAGLAMLTRSLARELAPEVRVNGVAPGVILAPAGNPERLKELVDSVPLAHSGSVDDIAHTLVWLATQAPYITGQILTVDGGRSLSLPGG